MKSIKYILFTALLVCGCKKDYLTLTPISTENSLNYFKTKDQFIQAVNGAYSPLQSIFNGSFWALGEMRADNTSYENNTDDQSGTNKMEIDEFRELGNNDMVQSFFSDHFTGIGRCNVILTRLPNIDLKDAVTTDRITGQASFLRAYYYFNLVRLFGSVPLVLKEVTSRDEAFAVNKRVPVEQIYAAIIADATTAIAKLPEKYEADTDKGRATRGAARALLADVYLTTKQYDLAIAQLRPLLTSVYSLEPYADNFNVTKENGPESIFEVQFMEGPNGLGSDFIDTFAPFDVYDDSVTGFEINNDASNGWNIPTQDFLDSYEKGDTRREASVREDFVSDDSGEEVPYIKKYQSPHAVRGITGSNVPVYRFSNVLLMLAECLNEKGFAANGEAFQLLNQVRTRAGLPDKTSGNTNPDLNVTSQEEFRDAILQERRIEFSFENQRWFDLLRTGKATEVMKAHAAKERETKDYISAGSYSNIRLLYQYPQRELNLEN